MLPAWLNQRLVAPVFFVELPRVCFPLGGRWSARPSSDQGWSVPALQCATPASLSQLGCCPRACYPDRWPSWGWPHLSPNSATGSPGGSWSPRVVPPCVLWRGPGAALSAASWTSSVGSPSWTLCWIAWLGCPGASFQPSQPQEIFVPSAARIWNSLPEYIPSLQKRACFKKEVNRYLGDN